MAVSRARDTLQIEATDENGRVLGVMDNFTSFTLTHDLRMPSEAAFEVGDDGSWNAIATYVQPGTIYKVSLNGAVRLVGRVEYADIPIDSPGGASVRFTVRTKLADAQYTSAPAGVRVKDTTLKTYILELYGYLGYTEDDFIFDPQVARELLTGKPATGGLPDIHFEKIKVDAARVNPPETIYEAADKHLRRFGLMQWDSPDDKIVIGYPDDTQAPTYYFRMNRGREGVENNIVSATRTRDWSGVPSEVMVWGKTHGKGQVSSGWIAEVVSDRDVVDAGFYRPIVIITKDIKTRAEALHAANREMTARRQNKEAWEIELDGLSWWSGQSSVNYGVDTVCSIASNVAGGIVGNYLVHRVVHRRTSMEGDATNLSVIRKGLWVL
jgi:hypothetical protein